MSCEFQIHNGKAKILKRLTKITPLNTHLHNILVVKMMRHSELPDFAARELRESATPSWQLTFRREKFLFELF